MPMQLGVLRITISGIFVAIIGFKSLKPITREQWKWIAVMGFFGTFFPAFFFAYAETEIDSAVDSILNSLVPLATIITGFLIFKIGTSRLQVLGVLVGLSGTAILILKGASINPHQNYYYALFVITSTIFYALNVNIVKRYLQEVNAMGITVASFMVIFPFAFGILVYTGFFSQDIVGTPVMINSLGYVTVLAVVGTGIAKILFNKLIQISSPVFSTSVTYLMPVVAVLWGVLDGEKITWLQILAGILILVGVYFVNKKKR